MRGPIARATLLTTGVFGLRLVTQACALLVITRMLGAAAYGVFSGIMALALIVGYVAAFGMPLLLTRAVSSRPETRDEVLRSALPWVLGLGSCLLVVYVVACPFLFAVETPPLTVLLAIGAAEILVQPLLLLCAAEWQGRGCIVASQMLQMLPLILRLLVAFAVFVLSPPAPLDAYAAGYLAAGVASTLFAIVVLPERWPGPRSWRVPRLLRLREACGFGATEVTRNGSTEVDKALAASLLPAGEAGLYAASARIMGSVLLPVLAMTVSSLPRLFRDELGDAARMVRLSALMSILAACYGVLVAVLLWCSAPLLPWLFGEQFADLSASVRMLCPVVPGLAMRMVFGNILIASGRPWARVGFEVVGLVMLLVSVPVLARSFGLHGMIAALACSEWSMVVVGAVLARRALARR